MRGGGGVAGVAEWAAPPFPLNGANVAEGGQPQTLPAQLRGGAGSESRPPKSQGTCGRNWTGWPSRAEPRSWTCHCGCRAPPATWPLQGGGGQPAGSQRVPAASSRGRRVGRAAERQSGQAGGCRKSSLSDLRGYNPSMRNLSMSLEGERGRAVSAPPRHQASRWLPLPFAPRPRGFLPRTMCRPLPAPVSPWRPRP